MTPKTFEAPSASRAISAVKAESIPPLIPTNTWENEFFRADCVDGRRFMITEMRISDAAANLSSFTRLFGEQLVLENNFDDKNETNSSES